MQPDECFHINQTKCIEKFAILETKMDEVQIQNKKIFRKLEDICPAVKENSWWIERIKLAFVLLSITGLGLGVISWVWRARN